MLRRRILNEALAGIAAPLTATRKPLTATRASPAAMLLAFLTALFAGITAHADVVYAAAAGFEVHTTVHVASPPARAFDVFAEHVEQWWSSEHTWSGSANNLSIQTRAGGCFCERLDHGGSVEHLHVVFVKPGAQLTMTGGLGPLQAMGFSGTMRIAFTAQDTGTEVSLTYRVSGYDPKGADRIASTVNAMLSDTLKRYQRFADTGSPDPKP